MRKLLTTILFALFASTLYAQTPLDRAKQLVVEAQQLVDSLTPVNTVTVVPVGGDVQAAIDSAKPGDTIALTAGAIYTGTFILRNRPQAGVITITTAGTLAPGQMTLAAASQLAKLQSGTTSPAIRTEAGAHDYALVGLEVKATAGLYPVGLITLGAGDQTQTSSAQVPSNIVVDRCYIHGDPTTGAKRGIDLNGAYLTVSNSYISDIKGVGQDTQDLEGVNGPGPFLIVNNYLEAAGENIMFGGADPMIPDLVPSDVTIIGNYITKPLAWKSLNWEIKNTVEFKNVRRLRFTGNVVENSWTNGQTGFLIEITVRDQSGNAPWSTVRDYEVDFNVIRHGNQGINILGLDDIAKVAGGPVNTSVRMVNGSIHDNLIYDIGGAAFGGGATKAFIVNNGPVNLSIVHNTVVGATSVGLALSVGVSKTPAAGLVFENNAFPEGNYGITGDGQTVGALSWAACVDAASVFDYNLIAKTQTVRKVAYPGSNITVGTVTFDGNFASTPAMTGSDGKPVGADLVALKATIPGVDLSK